MYLYAILAKTSWIQETSHPPPFIYITAYFDVQGKSIPYDNFVFALQPLQRNFILAALSLVLAP